LYAEEKVEVRPAADADRRAYEDLPPAMELGIWLSGVESFLCSGPRAFAGGGRDETPEAAKEFRLLHSVLQKCALLLARVSADRSFAAVGSAGSAELDELARALREILLLSGGLINSNSNGGGEWQAFRGVLRRQFSALPAFDALIRSAEDAGSLRLPGVLRNLATNTGFLTPEHAELALVLPRFGVVLTWLSVVGRMLENDEPLKPALLIFARVNEQIFDLTGYINNRLERFPDDEAEIFSSLDAAAYTASIELKKVYSQELAGLSHIRPSPSIYARMETAYALLKEGFEQMLAGFARLVDPDADMFELFPAFQVKLDRSVRLRRDLYRAVKLVQAAEAEPERANIDRMQAELRDFMLGTVKFLFYKDTETVERFVEEILVTKQGSDLVPLLHRFGAYLETLFGQVSLRAVLAEHPFEERFE
jgi:hypothetical protein